MAGAQNETQIIASPNLRGRKVKLLAAFSPKSSLYWNSILLLAVYDKSAHTTQ